MGFLKRLNPTEGVVDFWTEFRKPNPYRWRILGASVLLTGTIIYSVASERSYAPPLKPDVTYITTFAPGRSDAEIVAGNIANQKRKDELAARHRELEERKKEMYRELGRATGIDVDKMEADIAAEEAAQEAAVDEPAQ